MSTNDGPTEPYYTGTGPGHVMVKRPTAPPPLKAYPVAGNPPVMPDPLVAQKFGPAMADPILPPDLPPVALKPALPAPVLPIGASIVEPPIAESTKAVLGPVVPLVAASIPYPLPALDPVVLKPEWPRFGGPIEPAGAVQPELPLTKVEPGLIAPAFPNPMGPVLTPPLHEETPVRVGNISIPGRQSMPAENVLPLPEPVQLPIQGVSLKVEEPLATSVPLATTAISATESILVQSLRAFQSNRPDEAARLLRTLDATNQDVLMSLMPTLTRLGEGSVNALPPDELALMIDRLQTATTILKTKASLRTERVCFCRGVRKFADIDAYEPNHEFRSGDMVFLYVELKNFTSEPVTAAPANQNGSFAIRLGTTLELRDARNTLLWKAELPKTDYAQSPPQDYYHTYRFCVPEKLTPGTYTFWLNIVDKPTGRSIRKPIEIRIGQS